MKIKLFFLTLLMSISLSSCYIGFNRPGIPRYRQHFGYLRPTPRVGVIQYPRLNSPAWRQMRLNKYTPYHPYGGYWYHR